MNETQLRDLGQFTVRNQLASVPGASIPPPFGGKYRQIMVYVDPAKLHSYEMSPMDVVRAVNNANLILPSGDVKIGPFDYTIFTNSQFRTIPEINEIPLKAVGQSTVRVSDIGRAEDGHQIQVNVVKVDGQPSVYLPVMKQGGDTNTIAVVDGVKNLVGRLVDVPQQLVASVVFDASGGTATSGWHHHPGFVIVSVTTGSVTVWHSDCSQTSYAAGSAFVESGDDPGQVTSALGATTYVTYVVPNVNPLVFKIDDPAPACAG